MAIPAIRTYLSCSYVGCYSTVFEFEWSSRRVVVPSSGGAWRRRSCRLICTHSSLLRRIFFCNRNQVTVEQAYVTGQKVMGRASRRLGELLSGSPEDLRFRAFFGVSAQVAVTAWSMMDDHSVLPSNPKLVHFLWALAFMRTYPANNTTLSRLLGGSDPKTISKYVWPFIRSLFELNETVVSGEHYLFDCCFSYSLTFH